MATGAFDALSAHVRAEALSKLLHAKFVVPLFGHSWSASTGRRHRQAAPSAGA